MTTYNTIPVETVTRDAGADDLTDQDYRDIYDELRGQHSLRAFVEIVASRYSFAWWSKYERGDVELTRDARTELRRAVGLPLLPPTIAQATTDVDPNAVVYRVGHERLTRVVLVGHPRPLTIHLNGTLAAREDDAGDADDIADPPPDPHVTEVTRRKKRQTISLDPELHRRLNAARQAAGVTWAAFFQPLLNSQSEITNYELGME